ncbi:thermonuclease family protein [Hyphomonas sp. ND6WE1B]|uniref:thermonuclease family protein n=1 Tax=Hyphomonas sp. ND6WE1B TaxID=1848191 RepID=UPI0008076409|nr:thermonuclease family protein [Hyphomonas sp. ND6WE1B]
MKIGAPLIAAAAACTMLAACSSEHQRPSGTSPLQNISGSASVIDGDTIEIHGQRIRLSGFDTPERGAYCGDINVYRHAAFALSDFIANRTVSCTPDGSDAYNRIVAACSAGGTDLGSYMVAQGWGRDWPQYSHGAYAGAERRARAAGAGLWGMNCPDNLWGNRTYE